MNEFDSPQGEAGGLSAAQQFFTPVLGEKDHAFKMLDRALELRELWLVYLRIDPVWNSLRSDPRFPQLIHSVQLA